MLTFIWDFLGIEKHDPWKVGAPAVFIVKVELNVRRLLVGRFDIVAHGASLAREPNFLVRLRVFEGLGEPGQVICCFYGEASE